MIHSNHLKFHLGMWRVEVDGKHYCSQNKELLKHGLKQLGIAVIEPVVEVIDSRTNTEKLIDLLRSSASTLPDKQDALARLTYLANQGDVRAEEVIKSIPVFRSADAKYYTKQIGKTDFIFVTFQELHEYVDNVVLRSKLINELGNLYKGL